SREAGLGAAVHRDTDARGSKGRRVVDAVADHEDVAARARRLDECELALGADVPARRLEESLSAITAALELADDVADDRLAIAREQSEAVPALTQLDENGRGF